MHKKIIQCDLNDASVKLCMFSIIAEYKTKLSWMIFCGVLLLYNFNFTEALIC